MPSGLKMTVRITPDAGDDPVPVVDAALPTLEEITATRMPPEVMTPARMPPLTDVMPATTTTEKCTRPKKASKSWNVTLPSW